ncbi:MAG: hypothetical protein ACPGJV_02695 [Bacteriovoracaceae bacterium]
MPEKKDGVLLQKELRLNLDRIPYSKRDAVVKSVGEYIVKETTKYVRRGFSPVKGHGNFPILNKDYAEDEKGGDRTPNLSLEGDMLHEYNFNNVGKYLRIGYFHGPESNQADGHNQLTKKAKSWARKSGMPLRRWIPDENEEYTDEIMKGVNRLLDKHREDAHLKIETGEVEQRIIRDVDDRRKNESVSIDDLFSDDNIAALIFDELDRSTF